jgi:hypothetical protein
LRSLKVAQKLILISGQKIKAANQIAVILTFVHMVVVFLLERRTLMTFEKGCCWLALGLMAV